MVNSYIRNIPAIWLTNAMLFSPLVEANITFNDIAKFGGAGITYQRTESTIDALWDPIRQAGVFHIEDLPTSPGATRGAPGVALLDYDGDGDLDIYVTNGPGSANSLFSSQIEETGDLVFQDVGILSGVALTEQDSTGVCFGDIDNDGDPDLLVLGRDEANHLMENQGNGSFVDISTNSHIDQSVRNPSSCAMGDINNDGLLDILVGNSYNDWSHRLPIMLFGFEHLVESNQMLLNVGSNQFVDVSDASGVAASNDITWAVSMIDYDQDGDLDIVTANDQGGKIPAAYGGADVGFIRILKNDGAGYFTDVTSTSGTMEYGAWMGLAFGDLNHDGNMDMFASNTGDYSGIFFGQAVGINYAVGDWSSSWFLGDENGHFDRAPAGAVVATPFGWGAGMFDYDNDGDSDIIFQGGADFAILQDGTNPGAILQNDGLANFSRDSTALATSTDHTRRNVRGVSIGDLNDDGFPDVVSVSAQDWPAFAPLAPVLPFPLGGPFDSTAQIWPTFFPVDPADPSQGFVWSGIDPLNGSLSVEVNSADNGNGWLKVSALGTKDISPAGRVNRDGIGAIIRVTPYGGTTAMTPVLGGSSYASQHSLEKLFGMGASSWATVDILWPGGVRNQLRYVAVGESIRFPEIPCSYDDQEANPWEYAYCVWHALTDVKRGGYISRTQRLHFFVSAMQAYGDYH